jgi:ribonuclease R
MKPRKSSGKKTAAPRKALGVPDRETLLAFLATAKDSLGPREIARAFDLKGEDRRALKDLMKTLVEEGVVAATGRKAIASMDAPPESGLFEIVELDPDGDLLARASGREGLFGPLVRVAPGDARARADGPAPGIGDRFIGRTAQEADGHHVERIIKRIGASAHRIYGVFRADPGRERAGVGRARPPGGGAGGGRLIPADRKTKHDLLIEAAHAKNARDGDLVAVKLLAHRGYGPKRAEVLEIFGNSEDPKAASILAIAAHGIPMGFGADEIAQAEAAGPAPLGEREDLRAIPLVTIDPEDARDHDDAVWAESLPGGGHRILVAIADVAHYVTPNSPLDVGAAKRGNSVYFPDRVVPMLPERLSADLCSLMEGVERPCLAVEIKVDAEGRRTGHRFLRGLMKSAGSLTYSQAQAAIDGAPDETTAPLLDNVLKPLWAAYAALGRERAMREPLEIDSPERKIVLGPDGKVESIGVRERFDAHRLIEEMMILANVCAAETLEAKRSPLIYRIHDQPTPQKLAVLGDFLATLSIKWAKGQPPSTKRFNKVLALAKATEHAATINETVLRTQSQAVYDTANIGHFGLNLLKYAHFTSPIRRYADLVVHRALIAAHGFGEGGLRPKDLAQLQRVAEEITALERRAMAAERDATDRYVAAFMADKVGAVFEGRITSVTRFGLFVRLADSGADGLVPVSRLGSEYFHHDEAAHALVGGQSGDTWVLGAPVRVRLIEATPISGGLMFDVVSDPKAGKAPGRRAMRGPVRGGTPYGPGARGGSRPGGVKRRR